MQEYIDIRKCINISNKINICATVSIAKKNKDAFSILDNSEYIKIHPSYNTHLINKPVLNIKHIYINAT